MPGNSAENKLSPDLFKTKKGITVDPSKITITQKSKDLIKQGKVGQRYVINEYIDLTTGMRFQHWWPTVLEKIENENEEEKSKRIEKEKLIEEAKFDPAEVIKAPIKGLTGIVHARAKKLDEKTFSDPSKYAYITQKNNRLGGSARKAYDANMIFTGRSTLNWDVFELNDAFQYAYYFSNKNDFSPITDIWPFGILIARSLDWDVIQSWINEIEKIKPELNKDKEKEGPENYHERVLQQSKDNCVLLTCPEVKEWKNLFNLTEQERSNKLASLWMKTIYIASGLRKSKDSTVIQTDEDIVSETLKTAEKYGIAMNIDAIPTDIPHTCGATALMQAALMGKNRVIEMLLKAGANIHAKDGQGYSAIDYAIMGNKSSTLQLLLKKGELLTPLGLAVLEGKIDAIKNILESKIDIETKNTTTQLTAAHLATLCDQSDVMQTLAEYKADCNSPDAFGRTPAHFAALYGHVDMIETLMNLGKIDLNNDHSLLNGLAFNAAENGHFNIIKMLIKKYGLSLDTTTNSEGYTLAMVAAKNGHANFLKNLADEKASLTAANETGQSPLLLAVSHGHSHLVKLIASQTTIDENMRLKLAFCAATYGYVNVIAVLEPDLAARNLSGETLATHAAKLGQTNIILYLADNKVDITTPNTDGWTPLHIAATIGKTYLIEAIASKIPIDQTTKIDLAFCAAAQGHINVIEMLTPNLADNAPNGDTLATYAAKHGQANIIQYLADHKVNLSQPNHNGITPAYIAAENNQVNVIKQLAASYVDFNVECHGLTPMHLACAFNHTQTIQALIEGRSDIHQSSKGRHDQDTPLQLAIKNRQFDAIKILLDLEASVYSKNWQTHKSPIDFANTEVRAFITLHQLKKYITENKLENDSKNNIPAEQIKRIEIAENKKDWIEALNDVSKLANEEKLTTPLQKLSTFSVLPAEPIQTYLMFFSSPDHLNEKLAEAEKERTNIQYQDRGKYL